MIDTRHYIPILKTKAGELDALAKTADDVRAGFTPLLELIPIPPKWVEGADDPVPSKTIDAHVDKLAEDILRKVGTSRPFFVDGVYLENEDVLQDSSEPIAGILSRLAAGGASVVPVIGLRRFVEHNDACHAFAGANGGELCLRLGLVDLEDMGRLDGEIRLFLRDLKAEPSAVHCIVDYGAVTAETASVLKAALPFQIASLPLLSDWKSLTFAASAFPDDLADVTQFTVGSYARGEWDVWLHLRQSASACKRIPTFGDYAITHPELGEFDPRKMRMSPKVKYTHVLEWVVTKGEAYRRKKDAKQSTPGSVQYPQLASAIMAHAAWKGRDFSWGDTYIADCAEGKVTGNQQTWVTVGTSHHLAFVVRQIASLSGT